MKTTRPFRCDLNQIPYDNTVEVTNRFKGLDLIDRVLELWTEVHDIVEKAVIKTIPKKKKCKMAKWLSEEALSTIFFSIRLCCHCDRPLNVFFVSAAQILTGKKRK